MVLLITYTFNGFTVFSNTLSKAVKFYLQDLSYNPWRFDSWAGMAEARARKIGDKLNAVSVQSVDASSRVPTAQVSVVHVVGQEDGTVQGC